LVSWRGKEIVIDRMRNVPFEMLESGISVQDLIEVLETGINPTKRKKGIIEKWKRQGWDIFIVVIEDCTNYWLVRHVAKRRINRNIAKLLRGLGK
jgi:hypothetical protein